MGISKFQDLFAVQALAIMRESLLSGNSVDRWAAAQCLAHFGACDSVVSSPS